VSQGGDCDDADDTVHPGAVDACFSGSDEDCSGLECDDVDVLNEREVTSNFGDITTIVQALDGRLIGAVWDGTTKDLYAAERGSTSLTIPLGFSNPMALAPLGPGEACVVDNGSVHLLSMDTLESELRYVNAGDCVGSEVIDNGRVDIVARAGAAFVMVDTDSGSTQATARLSLESNSSVLRTHVYRDINGDGFGDIAVSANDPFDLLVYLGPFDGSVPADAYDHRWASDCDYILPWAAGDLDGDGVEELAAYGCGGFNVFERDLPSEFGLADTTAQLDLGYWHYEAGDVDGDGFGDLVSWGSEIFVVRGPFEGTVEPGSSQRVVGLPYGEDFRWIRTADVDGDPYPDLLIGAYNAYLDKDAVLWYAIDGEGI
jgi:hypothetical protein